MLGSGQNTAVLEMAAASGLALVPSGRRDPTETTTFGTGELIRYALNSGAERILIGIGGSATTDGGTGAAQAIGVRFVGSQDAELPPHVSGGQLDRIDRINLSQRDSRIEEVEIEVACDVDNPLCGPRGAAQVYGAQKGATPRQVEQLDRNLAHLADLIQRDLGRDVREIEGAGAAGGLGAGLVAFFDAALRPGIQIVTDTLRLSERIAEADLVITGEGRIDEQSMMGKVIAGVGKAARAAGAPVIALVGSVGDGADSTLDVLDSYHAISPANLPFEQARMQAAERLEETTCTVLKERVG
jgi:glycerate kinase